ncbi:DUF2639 domain-containing protein [Ammoniphilus sp. CFH 90114]|nr:DUF2639 domain-containing protein [Ammoniphilus sp. CFH 90114]RXT01929.1 DUF2639 domain-containing protein [Ammoniphilus sp. CFH 90114]
MHIGTKGYYVQKLKEQNIRLINGKRLESMKTHELANLYDKHVKNKDD